MHDACNDGASQSDDCSSSRKEMLLKARLLSTLRCIRRRDRNSSMISCLYLCWLLHIDSYPLVNCQGCGSV
jgi:hypothetical protein